MINFINEGTTLINKFQNTDFFSFDRTDFSVFISFKNYSLVLGLKNY